MEKRVAKSRVRKPGISTEDNEVVSLLLAVCNSVPARFQKFSAPRDSLRAQYSARLDTAINNRAKLADEFLPQIGTSLIDSLRVRGVIQFGSRGFTLGYVHDFQSVEDALDYGVMLLLDAFKPYGALLSCCHFSECRRYYIARVHPDGGPPNRTYCKPEHRDLAHDRRENRTPREIR